jgi:hypothetical protein
MADTNITIEEQQAEIENLKIIIADLQKDVAALKSNSNDTINDLKKDVATLKIKQAATAGSFIKEAEKEKKPEIPKENVTYDGKEYKWLKAAFRFAGSDERYTAEEAATDESIIARILKIKGQNILQEQA